MTLGGVENRNRGRTDSLESLFGYGRCSRFAYVHCSRSTAGEVIRNRPM